MASWSMDTGVGDGEMHNVLRRAVIHIHVEGRREAPGSTRLSESNVSDP